MVMPGFGVNSDRFVCATFRTSLTVEDESSNRTSIEETSNAHCAERLHDLNDRDGSFCAIAIWGTERFSDSIESEFGQAENLVQFHISASGGTIDIVSKDPRDLSTRDSIRAYGKALAEQLRKDEFELLFTIGPANPEFVKQVKNGGVGFSVEEEPFGVRLGLGASNQQTRTAIHEFIRIAAGRALAPHDRAIDHPGNNLGWDAPPAPDLKK